MVDQRKATGPGALVGLLVGADERLRNDLFAEREAVRERTMAVATTDPRMKAALKLLGYETIGVARVSGVERFMCGGI